MADRTTDTRDDKRHFFVSFNQADRGWATWIAWVLEEKGYSVFFQDWDFGGSFIEHMHHASMRAERTLVVLSDHYLHSEYARSEAWRRLANDPVGREDRVVIVKVGKTTDLGLFSHFAHLDLTNYAEADAERLVVERARKSTDPSYRPRPSIRPSYPGPGLRDEPDHVGWPHDVGACGAEPNTFEKPKYPGPLNTTSLPRRFLKRIIAAAAIPIIMLRNRTSILVTLTTLGTVLVILLAVGWSTPLRYSLPPSYLKVRLDSHGPPPVTSQAKPALTFYGSRDNNKLAMRLEGNASQRFEMDTGVRIDQANPGEEDRLSILMEALKAKSHRFDAVEIDIIWLGALAPHLINLKYHFEKEKTNENALIRHNMVGDQVVAIPWFQNVGLLFYRSDLLQDSKLSVPNTWDELEEAAAQIQAKQKKVNPEFIGFAWQGAVYEGLTCNALEWIASWGGLDANTGEIDFGNQAVLDALDNARTWVNGDNAISSHVRDYYEENALQKFLDGEAAFLRTWSNDYARVKQAGIKFDVAPLPSAGKNARFGALGGWQLAVPKYSLNQYSAIEFILYLSSREVQKWRAIEGTYWPAIEDIDADSDVREASPFLANDQIRKITRIVRPSDRLGDRYTDFSKCIQKHVGAALESGSREHVERNIIEMRSCIEGVSGEPLPDL